MIEERAMSANADEIESAFGQEMHRIYQRALSEAGYKATRFLHMLGFGDAHLGGRRFPGDNILTDRKITNAGILKIRKPRNSSSMSRTERGAGGIHSGSTLSLDARIRAALQNWSDLSLRWRG